MSVCAIWGPCTGEKFRPLSPYLCVSPSSSRASSRRSNFLNLPSTQSRCKGSSFDRIPFAWHGQHVSRGQDLGSAFRFLPESRHQSVEFDLRQFRRHRDEKNRSDETHQQSFVLPDDSIQNQSQIIQEFREGHRMQHGTPIKCEQAKLIRDIPSIGQAASCAAAYSTLAGGRGQRLRLSLLARCWRRSLSTHRTAPQPFPSAEHFLYLNSSRERFGETQNVRGPGFRFKLNKRHHHQLGACKEGGGGGVYYQR